MKYAIDIKKTIGKSIIVESNSIEDAVKMVKTAFESNLIQLDLIENELKTQYTPSDIFDGGIVPYGTNVSFYEHLDEHIIDTTFTSYWDGGVAIHTSCKVNLLTKEVFDIKTINTDGLENLEGEDIEIGNYLHPVYKKEEAEEGDYWYEI